MNSPISNAFLPDDWYDDNHPHPLGRLRPHVKHMAWDDADASSGGVLSTRYESLARIFPQLTAQELRVAVLIKLLYRSWQIAEMLCCDERTIENHRTNIRRKIKLPKKANLITYMIRVHE